MELKSDFVFKPLPQTEPEVRARKPDEESELGPLYGLLGKWAGKGFNQIWRPHHPMDPQDHFLELNVTDETLEIQRVKGNIPNRGLLQPDIDLFGVHYLQQLKDHNVGGALHFEPGIWLKIPPTTDPSEPATVARLGSIPHGTVILAQGVATESDGPPTFQPVSITPFEIGNPHKLVPFPESDLSKPTPFRSGKKQLKGITQEMVNNPNSLLEAGIKGKTILHTTTLTVTSDPNAAVAGGGTANTAFLQGTPTSKPNADASLVTATFWIETVKGRGPRRDYRQLQYTQRVLLNFNGLSWPHVTVNTLRLS